MNTQNPYEAPATGLVAETDNPEREEKVARSIGGWLILVGIGVTFTPPVLLFNLLPMYARIFSTGMWARMTTHGSQYYNPVWQRFLIGEMITNAIFFCIAVTVFYLFYSRKAAFPKWYIFFALFNFIFVLADELISSSLFRNGATIDPEAIGQLSRSVFTIAIWGPYMLVSKRVKETFIK